jgi:hypothetical protein
MEDSKGPKPPKKEDSQMSNVFTINLDQFNDDVPGVTRLLSTKNLNSSTATAGAPVSPASLSVTLQDFGVMYELRFCQNENEYVFQQAIPHQGIPLAPWQSSVLDKMVFSVENIELKSVFQEFDSKQHPFVFDVFGIDARYFLQVVQLHNPSHQLYVYISDRTLAARKAEFLETVKQNDGDSSVELQSA